MLGCLWEGVLVMEGVKVSDVGHRGPVGMRARVGLGAHGVMWLERGVSWGAGCGDGAPRPIGCWGGVGGPLKYWGWEAVEWLEGGRVPVAGLEVPVPWGAREGGVRAPAPHVTLWARR